MRAFLILSMIIFTTLASANSSNLTEKQVLDLAKEFAKEAKKDKHLLELTGKYKKMLKHVSPEEAELLKAYLNEVHHGNPNIDPVALPTTTVGLVLFVAARAYGNHIRGNGRVGPSKTPIIINDREFDIIKKPDLTKPFELNPEIVNPGRPRVAR